MHKGLKKPLGKKKKTHPKERDVGDNPGQVTVSHCQKAKAVISQVVIVSGLALVQLSDRLISARERECRGVGGERERKEGGRVSEQKRELGVEYKALYTWIHCRGRSPLWPVEMEGIYCRV